MMKRVVCRAFGTPDGVVVEKAPVPEPGPHDVLVRTTAANVSFVDRMIVGGRYQVRPPLPFTPGAVGAGEVVEAGSQVTHLTPGPPPRKRCRKAKKYRLILFHPAPTAALWWLDNALRSKP